MSRKATTEVDEREELDELVDAPAPEGTDADDGADEHGFWDGPSLDEHEPLVADDHDADDAHETRVYMGEVTQTAANRDEVDALAEWAAAKACAACRTALETDHEPDELEHDECRQALRAARLLRRYL